MAGNVYSTYELAREKAVERMTELETDIFICNCKFKSGQEFTLKTRHEIMGMNYLYMVGVPFRHHFKDKKNAEREASIFVSKSGKPVYVCKKTYEENGYIKTSHYYLTHKEPCLT